MLTIRLLAICVFYLTTSQAMAQEWLDLYNQSIVDYENYRLDAAREKCDRALSIFTADVAVEHTNVAAMLRQLSLICYENGDVADGLDYATRELAVLSNLGQSQEANYGSALFNLGQLQLAAGNYQKAKQRLGSALENQLNYYTEGQMEIGEIQGNLAIALFYLNENCEALFEKAINCLDQNQVHPLDYFNIAYTYAEYCVESDLVDRAIAALLPLVDGLMQEGGGEEYASLLVKLGSMYESKGENPKASKNYALAIQSFENSGEVEQPDYLIALNNLSLVYQSSGAFDKAAALMNQLVNESAGEKNGAYFLALANLGNIHFASREFEQALVKYESVISQFDPQKIANQKPYQIALAGKALVLIEQGNHPGALATVDQALAQANMEGSEMLQLLKTKAVALTAQGKYKDSENALIEALALANGPKEQIEVKQRMANLYTVMNRLEQAELMFLEVREVYDKQANLNNLDYASFLSNYATFLQSSGNFVQAEANLLEAAEIKRRLIGDKNESFLTTYENLGILYLTTGRFSNAQTVLENVLGTKQNKPNTTNPSLAYSMTNLGVLYKTIGEYGKSEELLKEAMKLYATAYGQTHIYYANTANELGLLYLKMGNTKAARPLFETAAKSFQSTHTKFHTDYASAIENLATLYHMEGETEKSKVLLEEVLEIDEAILGIEHPLYSKTLHNLASILEDMGRYEEASALYAQSLDIYENIFGKVHPSYANTLYNVAVLEQELENFEKAKANFEEVIAIRSQLLNPDHPDLAYSYFGLASVKQKLDDFEGARLDYQRVLSNYLQNIQSYFPSLSEEEKSAFYAKIKPVFEAYQDFAVEYCLGDYGNTESKNTTLQNLYNLQLSTKALLLNATNKVKNRILNSDDPQLIARFRDWNTAKEAIVKALSLSNKELDKNKIDVVSLQQKSNDLEKELSKLSQAFASEFDKKQIVWSMVRDALTDNEAAIEILRIRKNTKNDSVYYATLIIRKNSTTPQLVIVPDGINMEMKFFKQYKNLIVFKMENNRSFAQYWQPIDAALAGINQVYLSSDGVYNKVNVNTLFDPAKKEYVFDKYSLVLLSNTRELLDKPATTGGLKVSTAEIFGFPDFEMGSTNTGVTEEAKQRGFPAGVSELPGTLDEINHISHTLDQNFWKYKKHERADANEFNIKQLDNPKLLHIATHGFFMSDAKPGNKQENNLQSREARYNPLFRSGLLMAGATRTFRGQPLPNGEDGILTAYEAMNLNLDKTELVVMSACETGLGEVKNGEGVYGLQRAFIVAGTQNLIMSLWKVNDETTQKLMSRFYANWVGGQTKKAAFNEAIKSLKKEYKQPYYWGAFVMLGN